MFDEQQKAKFKKIFITTDKDSSGYLDRKEFKKLLRKLGSEISPKSIDLVIKLLDDNRDGVLDFQEFMHFMYIAYDTTDEYDVLFFAADNDQSGLIDEKKFKKVVAKLNLPVSKEQINDTIFDVQGFDDHLKMTYEQFKIFVSKFVG